MGNMNLESKINCLNLFLDDMEEKGGKERLKIVGFMRAYQLTMVTQERQAKIDIIEFLDRCDDSDIPINGFTQFMINMNDGRLH